MRAIIMGHVFYKCILKYSFKYDSEGVYEYLLFSCGDCDYAQIKLLNVF